MLSRVTTPARVAYQTFLALWKDSDPDIPILVAAKSEYAKLRCNQAEGLMTGTPHLRAAWLSASNQVLLKPWFNVPYA